MLLSKMAFKEALEQELKEHLTLEHPIFIELLKAEYNLRLLQSMALEGYQLTKKFAYYIAALLHHCKVDKFRRRLAINLYEEETGQISGTENHLKLMQRFLKGLHISDKERDEALPLPSTVDLIEYRWQLVNNPETFHLGAAAVLIASEGQNLEKKAGEGKHSLFQKIYNLTDDEVAFFSVHAKEDVYHVQEGYLIVSETCTTAQMQEQALETIRITCQKFWNFYEEIYQSFIQPKKALCI